MPRALILTVLLSLTSPLAAAQSTAAAPASTLPAAEQATVNVINRTLGSVLYITATMPSTAQGTFSSPIFADPGAQGEQDSGSGFFVNAQGYALTNYHVVEGATRLTVNLRDSKQDFTARVVGTAPDYDLALIRVQGVPAGLIRPLPLGNSDTLKVGQTTIALGAPFGLQFSATTGIVSALERTIPTGVRQIPQNAIQTDAAINPGNSGGPLLDSAGRVIGINTLIFSPSGAATGIGQNAGVGFAIPINVAKRLLPQLQAGKTIVGPVIGVTLAPFELTDLTEQVRQQYKLPRTGALVSRVEAGGPAARAGVKGGTAQVTTPIGPVYFGGDVITAVNGQAVETSADLREYLFGRKAGERVTLKINRAGKTLTLPVTLAPGTPPPGTR
ncbi:trypsin-like serine protease [Deinococcus aerius]|uniref:Trypsin-like serine protease n=1 Tax=Deinococcus aerius TaxID=200253 RepID=A0A2I9CWU0_9DEIO|nr:trypsin-like peptidase domain-containing protein [Deinococcus aerius]GBF06482.1 trypsin-like serine protease [Deinococcus aerius]